MAPHIHNLATLIVVQLYATVSGGRQRRHYDDDCYHSAWAQANEAAADGTASAARPHHSSLASLRGAVAKKCGHLFTSLASDTFLTL